MSQYTPPPPQPPYQPPGSPVGYSYAYPAGAGGGGVTPAARRAGVMLFVIGGLSIAGAMCCGAVGSMLPQILAQQPEVAQQLPPEATPEMIRVGMLIGAGVALVYGVVLVVVGLFVRKGSKGAIVTALVLTVLALLYLGFSAARTVGVGAQEGVGAVGGGLCMTAIPIALYVLLLTWLIQALRSGSAVRGGVGEYPPEYLAYLQQQYAQQQQAYQQQVWQQQQQQGGQMPPPPPPAEPPSPPSPPPPPASGD